MLNKQTKSVLFRQRLNLDSESQKRKLWGKLCSRPIPVVILVGHAHPKELVASFLVRICKRQNVSCPWKFSSDHLYARRRQRGSWLNRLKNWRQRRNVLYGSLVIVNG
jgi:hypothetical protein